MHNCNVFINFILTNSPLSKHGWCFYMKNAGFFSSRNPLNLTLLHSNQIKLQALVDMTISSQTFPSCGLSEQQQSFFHFNKTKLKLVSSKPNYGCDDGNEQSSVNFFCQSFGKTSSTTETLKKKK